MKRIPALDRLRDLAPFDNCTERELRRIDRLTCLIEVQSGTVLCRQGSYGRETFFIAAGEAEVAVDGLHVAKLVRGDFFGEMAIIEGSLRTANVVALTTMELFVLSPGELEALLADVPRIARRMLATLSTRLRLANPSPEPIDWINEGEMGASAQKMVAAAEVRP